MTTTAKSPGVVKALRGAHWAVYAFSLLGAAAGSYQHLFSVREVMETNSPNAFGPDGKVLDPVAFWAGGGFGCSTLGLLAVHVHALAAGSAAARRGALLGTTVMFWSMAVQWVARGHLVGNAVPSSAASFNVVLGGVILVGALASWAAEAEAEAGDGAHKRRD